MTNEEGMSLIVIDVEELAAVWWPKRLLSSSRPWLRKQLAIACSQRFPELRTMGDRGRQRQYGCYSGCSTTFGSNRCQWTATRLWM